MIDNWTLFLVVCGIVCLIIFLILHWLDKTKKEIEWEE